MLELNFYANTSGTLSDGSPNPAQTPFWSSGWGNLTPFFTSSYDVTIAVPFVAVPGDFTWTVAFSGLQSGEEAGLLAQGPVGVGANYGDAWVNTASSPSDAPVWLLTGSIPGAPGVEPTFGALLTAPEPSTIALGVMGGCAFLVRLRRKV